MPIQVTSMVLIILVFDSYDGCGNMIVIRPRQIVLAKS